MWKERSNMVKPKYTQQQLTITPSEMTEISNSSLRRSQGVQELARNSLFSVMLADQLTVTFSTTETKQTSADLLRRIFQNVSERLEYLETSYEHAVRPTLAAFSHHLLYEKDPLPAAISAMYDLVTKLAKLNDSANNLLVHYYNMDDRLQAYVDLISQLKEILSYERDIANRYLYKAVLIIHDALLCTYSEELTEEQVKAIVESIMALQAIDWDRNEVRSLDKHLREFGLETVVSDKFPIIECEQSRASIS